MKKSILMVAFCLLSVALFAKTDDVLSLEDAIASYENDAATIWYDVTVNRVIEEIKELVAEDINATDDNNRTPLMYASKYGYIKIVKSLIAEGADIEVKSNSYNTALIMATYNGHIEAVKALIEAGANIDAKDDDGITALMQAAFLGQTEVIKALIEAGADIDAQDNNGETALRRAVIGCMCSEGHIEIVTALIEAGANLDAQDIYGNTALYDALLYKHTDIEKALKAGGAKNFGNYYANLSPFLIMLGLVWVVFGAIVFGLYYLLYKLTIKMKGNVQNTSFVVRTPLIIGWINLFGVTLFVVVEPFFVLRSGSMLDLPLMYYCFFATPISLGSIAISLVEYKKKLITSKRLRIIVLVSVISIVLCLWCGISKV